MSLKQLARDYLGNADLWNVIQVDGEPVGNGDLYLNNRTVRIPKTLRALAGLTYGSGEGWRWIAEVNRYNSANTNPDALLPSGQTIKLPHMWRRTWKYDDNGNVTEQTAGYGYRISQKTVSEYYENNRQYHSDTFGLVEPQRPKRDLRWSYTPFGAVEIAWNARDSKSPTGVPKYFYLALTQGSYQTYDRSGRVTRIDTRLFDYSQTPNRIEWQHNMAWLGAGESKQTDLHYRYDYFADGRVKSVTVNGDKNASGASSFGYDANRRLRYQWLGKGNGMKRPEISHFEYDNEGHILSKYHDSGRDGEKPTISRYMYANGQAVGETFQNPQGVFSVILDEGRYATTRKIDGSFPTGSTADYTAQGGESLQHVAAMLYGNPNLWYLLADANGLSADSVLPAGRKLVVPNTVRANEANANTFAPYREGEITGGQLPNVNMPVPKPKCGVAGQILIIIVAIIVTIYTAGAAASAIGASTTAAGSAAAGSAAAGTAAASTAAAGTAAAGTAAATTATVTAASMSTFSAGMAAIGGSMGGLGAIAAGVGAFAGSVASQLVSKELGYTEHFSLRKAATDGLAGGLTAGIASAFNISGWSSAFSNGLKEGAQLSQHAVNFAKTAAFAAMRDAVTQQVSVWTNLQKRVEWGQVAAAGLAAPISQGIGFGLDRLVNQLPSSLQGIGGMLAGVTSRIAGSAVQHGLNKAVSSSYQGSFNLRSSLINAVGSEIGDGLVDYLKSNEPYEIAIRQAAQRQNMAAAEQAAGAWDAITSYTAQVGEAMADTLRKSAFVAGSDEDARLIQHLMATQERSYVTGLYGPMTSRALSRQRKEQGLPSTRSERAIRSRALPRECWGTPIRWRPCWQPIQD
ncbi:LysM peptidoglycan-binding domain-containing protein [Chitinimonas lacunae]|uniref:LysM peptidoglycan-binding domain-containing protein n=1 Tax=Chitinimonas lacunae TaxID=1963018 RepID=A0ABV8MW40_9NEIS